MTYAAIDIVSSPRNSTMRSAAPAITTAPDAASRTSTHSSALSTPTRRQYRGSVGAVSATEPRTTAATNRARPSITS